MDLVLWLRVKLQLTNKMSEAISYRKHCKNRKNYNKVNRANQLNKSIAKSKA